MMSFCVQDVEEKGDRSHIITSSAADWDNVETVEAGMHYSCTVLYITSLLLKFSHIGNLKLSPG